MFNPIRFLVRLNLLLCRLESGLLGTTLVVMLFFAFIQVVLRNIFDTGIEWGDVFARHLVLWVGFLGATLATQDNRHIRIDALSKALPKKAVPIIEMFISLFSIIVSMMLAHAAYKFTLDEKMAETILFSGIPNWYFIVIMPIGFGLITFRSFIKLIEQLVKFSGNRRILAKINEGSELDISVKIKIK